MKISVVMSAYNDAATLAEAIGSILAQTERDFELIVIDDGSTDATPAILADYARRDDRIRVITQANAGLTRALIRGCALAQGEVIARHDSDDRSLPERFRKQLAALTGDTVLVSCYSRWFGPQHEHLYDVTADGESVRESLLHGLKSIRGLTGHGTAMFRRSDYEAVGGYREAFWFAQDLDLWLRLAPRGRIAFVPEVLYEIRYGVGDISAARRNDQLELTVVALQLRDNDNPEDREVLLARAAAIRPKPQPRSKRGEARALYFIASCLRRNGDRRFRQYAREAIRKDPFHLRAWLLLLRGI